MSTRTYWLDLFTGGTWQEFLDAGGEVSGFRENRWVAVQRIKPGDYLLCYLVGLSRFIGVLEVTSPPYKDKNPIWQNEVFPCRVKVRSVFSLTPETGIPITSLRDELAIFGNKDRPNAWSGHVRGSPAKWDSGDGEAILKAIEVAKQNPVIRPVDTAQLKRRPKAIASKIGPVTIPETDDAPTGTGDENIGNTRSIGQKQVIAPPQDAPPKCFHVETTG